MKFVDSVSEVRPNHCYAVETGVELLPHRRHGVDDVREDFRNRCYDVDIVSEELPEHCDASTRSMSRVNSHCYVFDWSMLGVGGQSYVLDWSMQRVGAQPYILDWSMLYVGAQSYLSPGQLDGTRGDDAGREIVDRSGRGRFPRRDGLVAVVPTRASPEGYEHHRDHKAFPRVKSVCHHLSPIRHPKKSARPRGRAGDVLRSVA